MGELGALFNPGMRHELAERKAKALRREEEGNAGDGELRIDLETGVATIKIQAPGGTAPQDGDDDAGSVDPDDEDLGAQDPLDADATDALDQPDDNPSAAPRPRVTGKSGRRRTA
ncbi:DUF6191 domain-containing protein [Nakamurella flavida]|nr:DUF6191 domain-containing protein [Nakamurella flavida]